MLPIVIWSQDTISGMVMEANGKNEHIGLAGANVFWLNTSVGTVTDIDGKFTISYSKDYKKLVISYVGFKTDTITITKPMMVQHWLKPSTDLDEVTLISRKQATAKSYLQSQNIITVSSDELLKAACCN